jgi:hypothetical protein
MENESMARQELDQLKRALATAPSVASDAVRTTSLPSSANQEVVDLYTQMLGRKPDPEGYEYYNQLFGNKVDPSERALFRDAMGPELARRPNIAFTPPSVSGTRAELNQVQNIIRDAESRRLNTGENISPFRPGLSASQIEANQRASQDRMLMDAYAKAGVPLNSEEFNKVQQQLRLGAVTGENIQEKVVNPLLEQRVANAYRTIGRTGPMVPLENIDTAGATADTFKAVDREGYNYWLDQLKSGRITGDQFQNAFLTAAATTPTGPNAKLSLDATNKARTALGFTPLTEKDLPGYVAPPPSQAAPLFTSPNFIGAGGAGGNFLGQGNNPITLATLAKGITPAPTTPAPGTTPATGGPVTPADFFVPITNPNYLFKDGGLVKK